MTTVTIHAGGGQGIPPGSSLAVEGLAVLPSLSRVAESTVHRRDVHRRVGEGKVLVADRAAQAGYTVDRPGQVSRRHQEPLGSLHSLEHGRVPMAHEAHLVIGLGPRSLARDE